MDEAADSETNDGLEGPEIIASETAVLEAAALAGARGDRAHKRAAMLIEEQIRLARLQREHLRTQHIRDRFLVAFDLALAVGGLVLVCIIVALLWDAWSSRSVILEPFDVPSQLATQGYSGKVVAAQLRNDLRTFQDDTRTTQSKRDVSDAWSNRIELQIPEAGISIDEVQALLHRWLSRDEHIRGSVAIEQNRLVLAVEGDRIPPREFRGPAGDLRGLVSKAAEYIYGSGEPYLFCVYLLNQGRFKEVIALARSAFPSASKADKPLLLNVWANALSGLGNYRAALEKTQEAVRLKPDFWLSYDGMMGMEQSLGHEESVVRIGRAMERRAQRGGWFAADVPSAYWENLDFQRNEWQAFHAEVASDMAASAGHGTEAAEAAPVDAWALAQMHDWRGAELELETSPGSEADKSVVAQSAFVRAVIALDRGDNSRAVDEMRSVDAIVSKNTDVASTIVPPTLCWLGLAEGLAGNAAKAADDFKRGGTFVDCYRFKGDVADHANRWAEAQKDYAAAVALTPSLPSPYETWGEALARHGQYDDAIRKFSIAHENGPHWADPLEHWGEALAAERAFSNAAEKYQDAARSAPQWGLLYIHWARALDAQGDHAGALEKLKRAWSLDLTPQQRASIRGCCG
jgi:tetratricopeptide (TPR) repeat protein